MACFVVAHVAPMNAPLLTWGKQSKMCAETRAMTVVIKNSQVREAHCSPEPKRVDCKMPRRRIDMTTMQVAVKETEAKKHIKSLREYIDSLKDLGEVQEVDKEVDWNLEIGAITRRVYETDAPAPLFNNIKGHPKGFRVFGAPAAVSRQEGLYLARVALSLGLNPRATGKEMIQALSTARSYKGVSPKRLASGPCKENIQLGEKVDLP